MPIFKRKPEPETGASKMRSYALNRLNTAAKDDSVNSPEGSNGLKQQAKKPSFFRRIVGFINRISPLSAIKSDKLSSHFSAIVRQADKRHASFQSVKKAAELCDDALQAARQRIQVIKRVHVLEGKMLELECFEKLSDSDLSNLKNLIERFLALNKDRNALRFQITGFDRGLVGMESHEDSAKRVLAQMEESERQRKIFRHDLSLLTGEKSQLEYDYDQMLNAQAFIRKLNVFLIAFFGVSVFALIFMAASGAAGSAFAPASILCAVLIVVVAFVYIFRQRIKYEIKLNLVKQQRAVELINKKSVVYAYHVNFLRYVYKKYNVRSAERLKKNLKDYSDYKTVTYRYDSIRNAMYQTEYEIENFLREKKISNAMITIERFAKNVDVDDKRKVYNDYAAEKRRLLKRLEDLDLIRGGILDELNALAIADTSDERLVNQIMEQYSAEVENMAKLEMAESEATEGEGADGNTGGEISFEDEGTEDTDSLDIINLDPRYAGYKEKAE